MITKNEIASKPGRLKCQGCIRTLPNRSTNYEYYQLSFMLILDHLQSLHIYSNKQLIEAIIHPVELTIGRSMLDIGHGKFLD